MKIFVLILLIFLAVDCNAQVYDPLTLTKKIFSKDTLTDIKQHITGEYSGHPNGKDIPPDVNISFKLLDQDDKSAVVNITLSDSLKSEFDAYLFLKHDIIWKVNAFRVLAMTSIIAKVNDDLKKLTSTQVDSVIASKPDKNGRDRRDFKSREEYNFTLGNTNLTLASDNILIDYFNKNRLSFEHIKDQLLLKGLMTTDGGTRNMKNIKGVKSQMKLLFINDVFPDNESSSENINFLIGGILDNSVGYLFIKNKKDVPKMSADHFIMVKEIGSGWYLYKTT